MTLAAFQFLQPGLLRDGELQVVFPDPGDVDLHLEALRHPETCRVMPQASQTSRAHLVQLAQYRGRHTADHFEGLAPAYSFWLKTFDAQGRATIAGGISLRVGSSEDLNLYYGHIGYHVYPVSRGHHYAERACRLLLDLARSHGMNELWITTNPENFPSRRTCQRLGCELVNVVPVPATHALYQRGERTKCRYQLPL